MTHESAQDSGPAGVPLGFGWADYLAGLVAAHGSLSAVADLLAAQRGHVEDVETIERGLRRLRGRGQRDGGKWGLRLLRRFGLPRDIEARVCWMGQYHTRFTDLPRSLCRELLQLWDRPPVSDSPARIWIQLGLVSVALRGREFALAREHLELARRCASGAGPAAVIELELVSAFVVSRKAHERVAGHLDRAEVLLAEADLPAGERACLHARLADQRGYVLNKPPRGQRPDHRAALALYQAIPTAEAPPFALCRRQNGIGWSRFKLGDIDGAASAARLAVQHAGDGGSLRLRAMGLNLLAQVVGGAESADARARALAIASRLEDEELRVRIERKRPRADDSRGE